MALLTRARGIALAGVTSIAVVMPVAQTAPAAALPAPQIAAASVSTAAPVGAETRKKRTSRSARSLAVRARVMRTGNSLKGTPYRHAGSTPRGFDCSGFTMYVYRKAGVRLTHSATAQMHRAKRINKRWARPGDLVFFRSGSRAYHVGIYAGKGRVLHSRVPAAR